MFSFLNFSKKFQAPKALAQFYQHAGQNNARWVSMAINKTSIAGSLITKELDLLTETDAFSLKMAESQKEIILKLWKNQESVCKLNMDHNSQLLLDFNQLVDKLLETEIHNFQSILNQPQSEKKILSTEISQEEKALEWMRVSFQVLEKAIIESFTNPEFLFQTLLFFGINPKTAIHEIRLIIFNLDIKFEIYNEGDVRIKIYNDKDSELGSNKKAALEGNFSLRKREMFDELIRLLALLSPGLKW